MTSWIDSFTQYLTTASLWIQIPVVLIVLVPISGVIALGWLRFIDMTGVLYYRLRARFQRGANSQESQLISSSSSSADAAAATEPRAKN